MLVIISYNIRGLTSSNKHKLLRIWLNETQHDVILLQELHMTKLKHLEIFRKAFSEYHITCSLGTWAAGGTLVMIKKKYNVIDTGTDSDGRIAYIKIIYEKIPIVIVSVFAPAQLSERCSFFKDIRFYIPSTKWLIVDGDFNCVPDNIQDRLQHGILTDNQSYPLLLQNMINPLLLDEIFRSKHPLELIYFSDLKLSKKNTTEIYYLPVGLSDHDSIVLKLNIPSNNDKEFHRWICNSMMITRNTFTEQFQLIWNVFLKTADFDSTEWWNDFKTSLIFLLQEEERYYNDECRYELRQLQCEYRFRATNPTENDMIQLDIIRKEIYKILEEKISNNVLDQQEQDVTSLSILAKARIAHAKSNKSRIIFLDHPVKGRVDSNIDMIETATNFYEQLYDTKPIDRSCWNELFDDIPSLNKIDSDKLECDITLTECNETLKSVAMGRYPGTDGITVEVWKKIFPIIGEYYVRMINTAKLKGHFHEGFLNALRTLLKKDDNNNGSLKNYRPLSLMNIDYKILSKVLSIRLRKVLDQIIHLDQSYGIPCRTIHDNVHIIRSIIEYYSRHRDPIAIIQWDQEKAFDRINHVYLLETLKRLGFGIRQGCPLSGGLFVLCIEPLLHNIRRNARIPGVLPPGSRFPSVVRSILNKDNVNVNIKLSAYADDVCTIAFNVNDERETQAIFELYNNASGGKTNKDKTIIFWISDWLDPPNFKSKIEREYCNFLGVPIDTKGKMPSIELDKMILNVKQQMGMWATIKLSLFERATVLKSFILSQLVYCFSLMPLPKKTIENLQKDINKFFWNNKHQSINFYTCVGKKGNGGFALLHLNSMIASYRIKCGLKIISTTPKIWKFYAYQHVGIQLRTYAPWIWTNLTPHFNDETNFFGDVACRTVHWIKQGGKLSIDDSEPSAYWQLINRCVFRPPICCQRVPHLKK
ncbi:unnamed protein product [Rotaria socialis]|uniref:Reverse transcriptase domain-containing protein n=1 Tax=Rotaria socialis TaxID=392032 RepID=A0A820TP00_9BILA|nr:unnamed protein product [Rotaria socialis]CAF4472521.1 unnamed protein product [Rotaria socialis]